FSRKKNDMVYILLHKPKILDIWDSIRKNPGIKAKRLTHLLKIPKSTLFRKLSSMTDQDLLQVTKDRSNIAQLEVNLDSKEIALEFIWRMRNWEELTTLK
ncbi:MAG: hypothetical protein ACFFCS_27950, partial [Candidatus Hodarchaeota archaeon]